MDVYQNNGRSGQLIIDMGIVDKVSNQAVRNKAYVVQREGVLYFGEPRTKEVRIYHHSEASAEIFGDIEQKPIEDIEDILNKFTPIKTYDIQSKSWR